MMDDLRSAGVDFLTIGQYLQPTRKHAEVKRFVTPDEFKAYETIALAKGFLVVSSSPLTRSSYHAGDDFQRLKAARLAAHGLSCDCAIAAPPVVPEDARSPAAAEEAPGDAWLGTQAGREAGLKTCRPTALRAACRSRPRAMLDSSPTSSSIRSSSACEACGTERHRER